MAYEVYTFKPYSKEFNTSCIAGLLKDDMELHKKDLQMLKNKIKEQECFASKINKTVVDTGNYENSEVGYQPEKNASTTSVEDDSENFINF